MQQATAAISKDVCPQIGQLIDCPENERVHNIRAEQKALKKRLAKMQSYRQGVLNGSIDFGDLDAERSLAATIGHYSKKARALMGDREAKQALTPSQVSLQRDFEKANNRYRRAEQNATAKFAYITEDRRVDLGNRKSRIEGKMKNARRFNLLSTAAKSAFFKMKGLSDCWSLAVNDNADKLSTLEQRAQKLDQRLKRLDRWETKKVQQRIAPDFEVMQQAQSSLAKRDAHITTIDKQIAFLEDMIDLNARMEAGVLTHDLVEARRCATLENWEPEPGRNNVIRFAGPADPPPFPAAD